MPIRTNSKTRDSRLCKSIPHFIQNSLGTMVRMYAMYQPLRVFFYLGTAFTVLGLLPILRFLYFYAIGLGDGHIQSLILGGVLLMMGFLAYLVGLVADLIGFNRQLLEMTLERVRRMELAAHESEPVHAVEQHGDRPSPVLGAGGKSAPAVTGSSAGV